MEIDFSNKVVLVTGGSRGIGAAIAQKFAESNAFVIFNFNKDADSAKKVLSTLHGKGHHVVKCDLSDHQQTEKMLNDIIDKYGKIDVLINNAGIYEETVFAKTNYHEWLDTWKRTLDINLSGAVNLSFLVSKHMVSNKSGKIINITSRGAFRGEPDAPAYGASKAALNSFSQSMAKALAPHNVQCFAVAPGFVKTDMTTEILRSKQGDDIRSQSPMNRVATTEDVATAVFMLAAPGTEFMTGTIIDVNGASYLRM